jgi:peptide-methionine (S)-S-oxide reductase
MLRLLTLLPLLLPLFGACAEPASDLQASSTNVTDAPASDQPSATPAPASAPTSGETQIATFGAGCYWCVEAVLEQLDGVRDVTSGFMGGHVENPSYDEVCSGRTGHAEVVQVTFDPAKLSYDDLLSWFWRLHDPTTLNRQGADEGTQYRSAIFWHSEAQRDAATRFKQALDEKGVFEDPVVTEITKASEFFKAEDYHQDYYRQNQSAGYCRAVIRPKLEKLGLEK